MLSLPKSILVSACIHLGLFGVFLLTSRPSGARILYKPQYQVRLVEPSEVPSLGAKKTVSVPSPPKPPPRKPPEEKTVRLPEKKVEVKPEIKKKEEKVVPAKVPEPPKETPPAVQVPKEEPKPAAEAPKETSAAPPDPQPERVLEDVLARLRKDAEKRTPAETGRSSGGAAAGWEQRQTEIRYHQYYDQVERLVRSNWIPPTNMEAARQDVTTVVSLTLLPDGRVLESFIEESSGDPMFDQSVMRAILKSTPLPPPPIGLRQDRYELGLRFHSLTHTR